MCEKSCRIKYSVIVPIYKSERTLERCVRSLLSQERRDVEIILVNDGSPDSSEKLCRNFKEQASCVIYLEKSNGGVSSARNMGLDVATGEFILFVDSDDYVPADFFSLLDETIGLTRADLIQFSHATESRGRLDKTIFKPLFVSDSSLYEDVICDAVCRKNINSPCGKVFRRSIIETDGIRFDERLSIGEDRLFIIRYALLAHSYAVSEKIAYVVVVDNLQSLSRDISRDYTKQFEILNDELNEVAVNSKVSDSFKNKLLQAFNFGMCRGVYHDAKLLHQRHVPWHKRIRLLRKACNKINDNSVVGYPKTRYCRLIVFPVRYRMCIAIDFLAWCLVHGVVKRR